MHKKYGPLNASYLLGRTTVSPIFAAGALSRVLGLGVICSEMCFGSAIGLPARLTLTLAGEVNVKNPVRDQTPTHPPPAAGRRASHVSAGSLEIDRDTAGIGQASMGMGGGGWGLPPARGGERGEDPWSLWGSRHTHQPDTQCLRAGGGEDGQE